LPLKTRLQSEKQLANSSVPGVFDLFRHFASCLDSHSIPLVPPLHAGRCAKDEPLSRVLELPEVLQLIGEPVASNAGPKHNVQGGP